MPKLKTVRGATKRFKLVAGNKKAKHRRAFRNHGFTNKTTKSKRQRRSNAIVGGSDIKSIRRMLRLQ